MTRAHSILVFDHRLDLNAVEAMTVSRLMKYVKLAVELHREREKQRPSR